MNSRGPNILLTSVANKVSLVKLFQEAQNNSGANGRVIGVDIDSYVAGLYVADAGHLVPRLDSPFYEQRLWSVLDQERIALIVPTRDEDVEYFAERKESFESKGVRIHAPGSEASNICADKWLFHEFLTRNGLPSIPSSLDLNGFSDFPAVAKPRKGKGAKGILFLSSAHDIPPNLSEDYMIQEKIAGTEYTIDYFADFDGNPICVVPRIRLRVEGGESKVAVTKVEHEMDRLSRKLGKALGLIGHNTIQCFKNESGEIHFIEINPRFGGGAPLGIAAGCKSPEWLIRLLLGEKVEPTNHYTDDLVMIRFSQDLIIPNAQVAHL